MTFTELLKLLNNEAKYSYHYDDEKIYVKFADSHPLDPPIGELVNVKFNTHYGIIFKVKRS